MIENYTHSRNIDIIDLQSRSSFNSNSSSYFYLSSHPSTFINCEFNNPEEKQGKKHSATRISSQKTIKNQKVKNEILPQFFIQGEKIKVLKTVEAVLAKAPKELWKKVHPKKAVAIEMCLLFLSLVIPKLLSHRYDNEEQEWKFLGGRFLRRVFNDNPNTYQNIIAVLTFKCETGNILELGKGNNIGIKATKLRFTEQYSSKIIISRILTTDYAKKLSRKIVEESYNRVHDHLIVRNMVRLYPKITFPTLEEILTEAKRIIENGGKIKRGRKLVFLNKRPKSYYKTRGKISFVEDAIEVFKYWTEDGFMIPKVCRLRKGGRVIDSLNMIPSWIRNLIKINGNTISECDFECLHPNAAATLYGGSYKYLTHKMIATALGIDEIEAKIENLSYFNKEYWQMKDSPVHPFYLGNEPTMISRIIKEKCYGKNSYKETSRKMLNLEVEIMTNAITELNKEGIEAIYIFDALSCESQYSDRVIEMMNKEALKQGVYSMAKLS